VPMPPEVMKRLIKRDITGKVGAERVRILRQALESLPGYYQGPYGKLRKWISEEIDRSRAKAKVARRETFQVPKEGLRQVAVVGPPNAGKSSVLKALSGAQIKVADYPFATLKPQAAIVDVLGARVQLVEVPGLLPGAGDDRGGGRALLAAIRNADMILYVAGLGREGVGPSDLDAIRAEVRLAGIDKPSALCLTGLDLPGAREEATAHFEQALHERAVGEHAAGETLQAAGVDSGGRMVACSTLTGEGLDRLLEMVWSMCGLIRVWRRGDREKRGDPFVLESGATVGDLARAVHKDLESRLSQALIWGFSARFPGQAVGSRHVLADGDEVELRVRG